MYLDGAIDPEQAPALNPLAAFGFSAREKADFAELLADDLSTLSPTRDLTDNMRMLARNCLRVLLDRARPPTLRDLSRFLREPSNPQTRALIEEGMRHSDADIAEFFADAFQNRTSLRTSKEGFADRLDAFMGHPALKNIVLAPEPLDLEALISAGKIIVVNLAGAGPGADTLGRMMVTRLVSIGKRRAYNAANRAPVHIFIDEAHKLVNPQVFNIMNEQRKFGLSLTLAHQSLNQVSGGAQETLWNGAAIKMIGATDEAEPLRRLFGAETQHIPAFQFAVRWGMGGPDSVVMLEPRGELRHGANNMSEVAWAAMMEKQVKLFYRPAAGDAPAISPAARKKFELR